ncbi:InlB B-repeat-containing protein [Cellulosilyticum sp. I15G10I2]|uniref:InlB B-repeat-containing protein n=1 Tax=Cellulosilyticum sp. I15G10I2 TaxID=1892843 RepID=UPI00085C7C97|nr:InlB B-repeat-containing protein [Cellulosilyticum sp. I15G10I2]
MLSRLLRKLFVVSMTVAMFSMVGSIQAKASELTIYYVDAVEGDDSNLGTSDTSPWKTLDKLNAMTFQPGDKILLKAGAVWDNQYLDLKGSGTADKPIIVDSYGGGPKPVINFGDTEVNGEGFGVRLKNVSYWQINNLEITSGQFAASRLRNGIWVVGEGANGGHFRHIYIKNCYVHDIFSNSRRGGGINFHARNTLGGVESTWDDILVEGCIVSNVMDTGIQTMTDVLLSPMPSGWIHFYDAFTNVRIRNNYVEKIYRDGILVRSSTNPLIEYNTTDAIGKCAVYDSNVVKYAPYNEVVAAQWAYYCKGAVFQYNVASNTKKLSGDGQPWDFDQFVYDSVYQYNYSYNNEGGTLLVMANTDGNVFRYNISQNDKDMFGSAIYNSSNGSLAVYNNVFYRGPGVAQQRSLTSASSGVGKTNFSNNIFYNRSGSTYTNNSSVTYSNNCFYGDNASVPNDPGKIIKDPLFVNAGGAGTSWASATAYQLRASSPCLNMGTSINLYNTGVDFFGNTFPYGAPDIGAYEYHGEPQVPDYYTVTFDTGLGSLVASQNVVDGSYANKPLVVPTLAEHTFEGWYTDSTYSTTFDFITMRITDDTTVYAKWTLYTPPPSSYPAQYTFDFEDGSTAGWETRGGVWRVITDGDSQVLHTTSHADSIAVTGDAWTDMDFKGHIKLLTSNGNAGLLFRYVDANNYYMIRINDSNDRVELYQKLGGTMTQLAAYSTNININTQYLLKINIENNIIKTYWNGNIEPVIEKGVNNSQLSAGKIGVRTASSEANFDNLIINTTPIYITVPLDTVEEGEVQ